MVISKAELLNHVAFSENIEDRNINPHILDAIKYDLLPKLGQQLIDALNDVQPDYINWSTWNNTEAFVIDDIVIHGEIVWKALSNNTGSKPSITNTDWAKQELFTFWYVAVKPYLAFGSCARYLVYAGKNFSQYGITKPLEPDSTPASGTEIAAMIRDLESKKNIEHNGMMKILWDSNWKFDSITYTQPTELVPRENQQNFGINAIE